MKYRVFTLSAAIALLLCLVAWVRSYLPDHWTVRAHGGSFVLVFYSSNFGDSLTGVDTSNMLADVRSWADASFWTRKPASWRALGFELVLNHNQPAEGFFVLAVPFWFLALPLAGATAWGAVRWRREGRWRRENRCTNCGYDLRGIPERCPECGAKAAGAPP